MCCAFEQELRDKIFSDFVTEEAHAQSSGFDFDESPLSDAILSLRKNGRFYLSMINMINCLAVVDSRLSSDSANGRLKRKLEQSKWKTDELADPSFISEGKDYTINYRDTAAHPNIMSREDAEICNAMTKELLCHFLGCKHY